MGMGTKEDDFVEHIFIASTHHYLLIFTNQGRVYWLKVYQVPQAGRASRGKALVNLINFSPRERIAAVVAVKDFVSDQSVIMATKRGLVKKTELTAFAHPRAAGIIAIGVDADDELIGAKLTKGEKSIFLGTRQGKAIRFAEEEVRNMGRMASGVIGIRLEGDDEVIGMEVASEQSNIITVSERGMGKQTLLTEYPLQGRGGKGTINLRTSAPKVGCVAGVIQAAEGTDLILISNAGKIIRLPVEEIPTLHRSTQGVKLIELEPEEKVVGMALAERESPERESEDKAAELPPGDDLALFASEQEGAEEGSEA